MLTGKENNSVKSGLVILCVCVFVFTLTCASSCRTEAVKFCVSVSEIQGVFTSCVWNAFLFLKVSIN